MCILKKIKYNILFLNFRSWLFGEKRNATGNKESKGWFPRCCVIEVTGDKGDLNEEHDKKED